jgi:hypothetical protein
MLHGLSDESRLDIGRHGDVEDFDIRIREKLCKVTMDPWNLMLLGDGPGGFLTSGSDGHRIESRLPVRNEMTVSHDEAGPSTPNPPIATLWEPRSII